MIWVGIINKIDCNKRIIIIILMLILMLINKDRLIRIMPMIIIKI